MRRLLAIVALAWMIFTCGPIFARQVDFVDACPMCERMRGVETKVAVIESQLGDIRALGKGVAVAVTAQLVLTGLYLTRPPRRPRRSADPDTDN